MPFQPRRAIVTAPDSGLGRATAVALAGAGMDIGVSYVTGASWPVDGGMPQVGPQAGSHTAADDWRSG
jgi:hypothetical protein